MCICIYDFFCGALRRRGCRSGMVTSETSRSSCFSWPFVTLMTFMKDLPLLSFISLSRHGHVRVFLMAVCERKEGREGRGREGGGGRGGRETVRREQKSESQKQHTTFSLHLTAKQASLKCSQASKKAPSPSSSWDFPLCYLPWEPWAIAPLLAPSH